MTGAPKVRLGTKRPSITSTCTQSAPPVSMAASSSRSRPRSAVRIEGAMRIVTDAPGWGSIADDEIDAALVRAQHAACGALVHDHASLARARGAGRHGSHPEPRALEPLARVLLLEADYVGNPGIRGAAAHHQLDGGAGWVGGSDRRSGGDDDPGRRAAGEGIHVADLEPRRLHHQIGRASC